MSTWICPNCGEQDLVGVLGVENGFRCTICTACFQIRRHRDFLRPVTDFSTPPLYGNLAKDDPANPSTIIDKEVSL